MDEHEIQQIKTLIVEMVNDAIKNSVNPQIDDLQNSGQEGFSAISKYLAAVEARLKSIEDESDKGIRKEIDEIRKLVETPRASSMGKTISQSDIDTILQKLEYLEKVACSKDMNDAQKSEAVYFAYALENAAVNANVDTIYDMFKSEFGTHASISYLNAIIRALKTLIRTDLSAVANSLLKKFLADSKTKSKKKKKIPKKEESEDDDESDEEEIDEDDTDDDDDDEEDEKNTDDAKSDTLTDDEVEDMFMDNDENGDMDEIENNLQDLKNEFSDPTKKNPKSSSRSWGIAKVYFHPDADKEDMTYIEDFVDTNSEPFEVSMWKSYSRSPKKLKSDWLDIIDDVKGADFRYHDRLALPKSAVTENVARDIEKKINEKKNLCVTIISAFIKDAEYILGYHFGNLLNQDEFEEKYLKKGE